MSGSVEVEGTTTPVGAPDRTSLRNRAFVLVLCAQAASGIVGGAAPMALPAIRDYFDTSSAAIQWYAALYSLGFALVLILAGPHRRPLRHPTAAPHRLRHLHRQHHRQRPGPHDRRAARLPSPAGHRRRRDGAAAVGHGAAHVPRPRPHPCLRRVPDGGGRHLHGRPARLGCAHHRRRVGPQLALGVPPVHPVRPGHAGRRLQGTAAHAARCTRPPRHRRCRGAGRGVVPVDVPDHPGPRSGLAVVDHRDAGGRRARLRRVPGLRAPPAHPRPRPPRRPHPLPHPQLRRGQPHHRLRRPPRLRRADLPDPHHPVRLQPHRLRGRPHHRTHAVPQHVRLTRLGTTGAPLRSRRARHRRPAGRPGRRAGAARHAAATPTR